MPEIAPFEALRYSDELLRDASSLICPPYDVITPSYQKELYAASSCNAVRLELPCEESPYEAAAARLREWLLEGELVRDPRPALYPYFQTFADPEGNRVTRCGFFAAMRLSEPSEKKVLPHEKTLSGPKADRLNLFRQTRANISPVFGIYADESGRGDRLLKEYAATHEPVLEAELQGVENRMWRITEPELLAELRGVLLERTVYIADGHHRYATGLNYRNERADGNSCHTGEEPYNFILTYLANMYDEGLLIFPIHRVVHGLAHFDAEAFLGKLGEQFVLRELDGREALKEFMDREQSSYAYGVVLPGRLIGIVLKGRAEDVLEASCPEAMRRLGLVVLHDAVLGGMLGISREAMASQSNLVYRKDEDEVFRAVESGEAQIGFVVHPTTVRQVLDVSDSGEVMPQKSTFFYPKNHDGTGVPFSWMNGAFKEVFHSASALETRAVGRKFAASLPGGAVVALSGDLGAGKTEFMRGVAEFFGCAEQLSSPTFPILNIYNGLLQGDEVSIHHFDLYRIERPSELEALGFGEYLSSAWCSFVEWAERFGEYGDRYTARVLIEYEGDESRVITIEREE